MSTVEIRRDLLEIEKLRQDIETELARRHNWGEQERFWRENAEYWKRAHRQDRLRNWIALAAIATTLGIAFGKFVL